MNKPAKATTINVSVDSVARVLYDADMMKDARDRGILDEALVFVPTYLHDLGDVGTHLLSELPKLPAEHPVRSKYDWRRVEGGLQAVRDGKVKVVVDKGLDKTSYEGPYELNFTE